MPDTPMKPFILAIVLLAINANVESAPDNIDEGTSSDKVQCFLRHNKRCKVNEQLDFTIQTPDEVQNFKGWSQLEFLCGFLERVEHHPGSLKCQTGGVPIHCYDCLHRNTIVEVQKRYQTIKSVNIDDNQTTNNRTITISKSSIVQLLASIFSLCFCLIFSNLVRTGKTGNCYIPILWLFAYSALSLADLVLQGYGY